MLKLQAVEISKTYRGRKVVDDVELEIGQGEVVGLLGPNGAGKTTTFSILVGLARPDSGRVLLNGDEITDLPMYLRARSGIRSEERRVGKECSDRQATAPSDTSSPPSVRTMNSPSTQPQPRTGI